MKVLIVSADNSDRKLVGGKHVHQYLLVKGLLKLGVEVDKLYHDKMRLYIGWWLRNIDVLGDKLLRKILSYFDYRYINSSIWFREKLRTIYDIRITSGIYFKNTYNVVHAHDVLSLLGISHFHYPKIATIHGYLARELASNLISLGYDRKLVVEFEKKLMCLERKAIKHADYIIAVDSRIKNYLIEQFHYPEDRITVIYNAIDTDRFVPVNIIDKMKIRTELGIPQDKTVVLVPRRMVEKNGVIYAARAAVELDKNGFFFVFIGDGPLYERVKYILENNNVNNYLMVGSIPNLHIHKYYQASDIALIPSVTSYGVQEATSLSMLEAMSVGLITVCSNIGGMKEIIKDGVNGFLVREKDIDDIVRVLLMIKNLEYDKVLSISRNAREFVLKNHSYLRHAERVKSIYEQISL